MGGIHDDNLHTELKSESSTEHKTHHSSHDHSQWFYNQLDSLPKRDKAGHMHSGTVYRILCDITKPIPGLLIPFLIIFVLLILTFVCCCFWHRVCGVRRRKKRLAGTGRSKNGTKMGQKIGQKMGQKIGQKMVQKMVQKRSQNGSKNGPKNGSKN